MATENKGMRIFMIVLNVAIWVYVAYIILPLVFGEESATPIKKRVVAHNVGSRVVGRQVGYSTRGRGGHNRWNVKEPFSFYRNTKDPFVPFLYKVERKTTTAKVQKIAKVINYTIPTDGQRVAEPITVLYRLSSIVKLQDKYFAILCKGGQSSSGITVEVGYVLPGGGVVKEINFEKKYVLVEKKGQLFKLVDRSPWVSKIKK